MNEAAGHQLDRTDQEIIFRVVSSYYDVLLAAKELEVTEQSAKTAQSIMDRSQARFDSGLTVESDLLTAKVRMAARQQEVIRARNTLEVTRAQLNTAMGMPLDSPFQTIEALAERTLPAPMLGGSREAGIRKSPRLEAHCLRGGSSAAERVDGQVVIRSAGECLCRLGNG